MSGLALPVFVSGIRIQVSGLALPGSLDHELAVDKFDATPPVAFLPLNC
jgi:hypothetical protein